MMPLSPRGPRGIVLSGIFALLLVGCDLPWGSQSRISRAEKALSAGDYNTAAVLLLDPAGEPSAKPETRVLLARAQLLRGDLAGAQAALANAGQGEQANELRARLALARRQYDLLHEQLTSGQLALAEPTRERYVVRALMGMGSHIEALDRLEILMRAEPAATDLPVLAAESHAALGRAGRALDLLDGALAGNAGDAKAWAVKSRVLLETRDPVKAREAWKQALKHAPGQLGAEEQAALLSSELLSALSAGDLAAADEAYGTLLALMPQAPLTGWTATQLQLAKGETTEALAAAQRLAASTPDFPLARPSLIGAQLAAGTYELAALELGILATSTPDVQRIESIRQLALEAASADAKDVTRPLRAGQAAMLLEQHAAARNILLPAAKAFPDSSELKLAIAQLHLRAGQPKLALEQLSPLAEQAPQDLAVLAALASAQSAAGDAQSANATLESIWSVTPSGPAAVALMHSRRRLDRQDALEPLEGWVSAHPNDIASSLVLASAYQQAGQLASAAMHYERVVTMQPRNAVALNNLAWTYYKLKDNRALATARLAYDLAGQAAPIADTYAWLLAESAQAQLAVPILSAASRAAPGNPSLRFHLAAALLRTGESADREAARKLLSDLKRDDSAFEGHEEARRLIAAEGLT
jgi:tetratricopeptide (TPR) repeat protein